MTSRASLKLFLCNVLFSDNISVLKVYSKSFVYNAFNDFAGYSPHPSFICSVKKDIAKHSINEDQSTEETGKIGTTVQCIIYMIISQTVFTLRLIPTIIIISYAIFQLIIVYLGM